MVFPNLFLAWYFSEAGPGKGLVKEPGDLEVDSELVSQFEQALAERSIHLRFFSGGWDSLHVGTRADMVLSSETVYSLANLHSLCRVLQSICWPTPQENAKTGVDRKTTLCLVAAKVLYFGVGGGIDAFLHELEHSRGWHAKQHEQVSGVGRVVLQIGWAPE